MSVSDKTRQIVRARADFRCEYCSVAESDTGGELTIDHHQPQAADGGDDLDNLVYACYRCNLYKGDYWTMDENAVSVWNPRLQSAVEHFWMSDNGTIYGLTQTAVFTIMRLRLNRSSLVSHRRRKVRLETERQRLEQMRQAIKTLAQTNEHQSRLLAEQQKQLAEQKELLDILLNLDEL